MNDQQRSGLGLAFAGFAFLSVGDAVVKSMAGAWPAFAVAALRFSIGAAALSLLLLRSEGPRAFIPTNPWLHLARGICLSVATVSFFSAIYLMPLAEAMAISLGWWWFGDRPDLATLAGATLIVSSGLYLWQAGKPQQPA